MDKTKKFIKEYYLQIFGLLLISIPVLKGNCTIIRLPPCGIYCLFTIT